MSSDLSPILTTGTSSPAVRVENVSKVYRTYSKPTDRLIEAFSSKAQRHREFQALNSVSFDLPKGETLGIVGRNGSGKSTLLQIICGTLQPSSGEVSVQGRVAALLELGAGFNAEFTGRENVHLNATILGMSRDDIAERFDEIAAFADLGDFIDQPVKTYSSGMFVRLAFATAINTDPDILVVDEALAVGDEAFQRKCFARIEQIKDRGGTILFVSHSAGSITQLCTRAIFMDRGEVILEGLPKTVVNYYHRFMNLAGSDAERLRDEILAVDGWAKSSDKDQAEGPGDDKSADGDLKSLEFQTVKEGEDKSWYDPGLKSPSRLDYETKGISIQDVRFETPDGRKVNVLHSGHTYVYKYGVKFEESARDIYCGMFFKNLMGQDIGGASTENSRAFAIETVEAGTTAEFSFEFTCNLRRGSYVSSAGLTRKCDETGGQIFAGRILDAVLFRVHDDAQELAVGPVDLNPSLTIDFVDAP